MDDPESDIAELQAASLEERDHRVAQTRMHEIRERRREHEAEACPGELHAELIEAVRPERAPARDDRGSRCTSRPGEHGCRRGVPEEDAPHDVARRRLGHLQAEGARLDAHDEGAPACAWFEERGRETEGCNAPRTAELSNGDAAHGSIESEIRDEVRIQRRQHVAGTGHRDDRVHAGRIDPCAGECVTSRGFCKGDGLPCVVLGTFTEGMTPKQLVDRDDQVAPTYS